MKHYTLAVLTLLAASLHATAKEITPQQALAIATRYVTPDTHTSAPARTFSVADAESQLTAQPFYAFCDASGKGFVIISGDDCVTPVLGYSTTGSFDEANMPIQMREWLQSVSAEIDRQRTEGGGTARTLAAIDPNPTVIVPALLTTQWDQTYPYNRQTPTINDRNTYTGCVATATAQVMRYHRWPEKGMGSVAYDTPSYDKKRMEIDFTLSEYDWDNMLDKYNLYAENWTSRQAQAIGTLMRDVGAACHLAYGTNGTSGFSNDVAIALMRHFGYNAEFHFKSDYSTTTWMQMIKTQLNAGQPVIYSGVGINGGGHEFVVDGYDSNGYLHVNWGWSGDGDGFFALANFGSHNYCLYTDAVFATPDRTSTTPSDFQTPLWAVYDIGRGFKPLTTYTTTIDQVGYLDLYLNIQCASNITDFNGQLRVALKDKEGHVASTIDEDNYNFTIDTTPLVYRMSPDYFNNLPDGTYDITVESTCNRTDGTPFGTWTHAMIDANVISVTKNGDNLVFTRRQKHMAPITIESLNITPDAGDRLQTNSPINIALQLNSEGDDCLGRDIALTLTSANNTETKPVNIKLGKAVVFEGQPYQYDYTLNATANDSILPGHYTASISTKGDDGSWQNITPDTKRVEMTIENNASNYATAQIGGLQMTWSDGEAIDVNTDKVIDIDLTQGRSIKMRSQVYFLQPLDYTGPWSRPADFSSTVALTINADGKDITLNEFNMPDCSTRQCTSYITRGAIDDLGDATLYNRTLTLRYMKTVPYSYDMEPMLRNNGTDAAIKVRLLNGATAIEQVGTQTTIVSRHDTLGRKLTAPQKGINIVKMSDGRAIKVVEK